MKMAAKMSKRFPGVTGIGEFKYLKRLTAAYLRGVEDGRATARGKGKTQWKRVRSGTVNFSTAGSVVWCAPKK